MRRMVGVVTAAGLLAGGLVGAALVGRDAQAGSLEAVHSPVGVAPVPAASGYADLVAGSRRRS